MKLLKEELKKIYVPGEFNQGEVWIADDKHISSELKRFLGWKEKESRLVVIVQSDDGNKNPYSTIILVAPLTSKSKPTTLDIPLKSGEANLEKDSVIQISLIQPVPKAIMRQKIGNLSDEKLELMKTRILQKFGFLPIEVEKNEYRKRRN